MITKQERHVKQLKRIANSIGLGPHDGLLNRPGRGWWAVTRIREQLNRLAGESVTVLAQTLQRTRVGA